MKQLIFTVTVLTWISGLLVSGCPKSIQKSQESPTTKETPISESISNAEVVFAKVGSSLEIVCKDEKTANVTSIQLVKKEDKDDTLVNSLYPKSNETYGYTIVNRSVSDSTVMFKSVAKHHAGLYQCLVSERSLKEVLLKSYNIVIIDNELTCKESLIESVNATEVQLNCSISYQGITTPMLRWRNDRDLVNVCDYTTFISNFSSSISVKIPDVEKCEQGRLTYTCELVHNNSAQEDISCSVVMPCSERVSSVLTTVLCVVGATVLLTLGAVILCLKFGKCGKWKRETDTAQMTDPTEAICYENVERKHNLPDVARTNDNSAIEQLYAQVDHQAKSKNQNNSDQAAAVYEDPEILKPKSNSAQKKKKSATRPPPRTNVGPVDGTVYAVLDNNAKPNRIGSAVKPPAALGNQLPPSEPAVYAPVVHLKR